MTLLRRANALLLAIACVLATGCAATGPTAPATSPLTAAATPATLPTTVPATPRVTVAPIPDALLHVWLGPPRSVAGLGGPQELSIITFQGFEFYSMNDQFGAGSDLESFISAEGPDSIRMVSRVPSGGCQSNDTGTYRWATSSNGEHLTMTAMDEACAARAEAVAGEWVRAACKDFGCLGSIDAGEHVTAFLEPLGQPAGATGWRMQYGAMSYTVPAGWANANDAAGLYNLVLQTDYAQSVPHESAYPGIYVLVDPGVAKPAQACTDEVTPGAGLDGAQVVATLAALPGVEIGKATSITVAGRVGTARDVTMPVQAGDRCAASGGVPVLTDRRLRPGEHWRLILVDLDADHTLAIVIDDAAQPGRFDDLVAQAMPIIASFEVHPPKS
jgi:hypothetical protein